jgi:hypothetical protein
MNRVDRGRKTDVNEQVKIWQDVIVSYAIKIIMSKNTHVNNYHVILHCFISNRNGLNMTNR